MGYEMYQKIPDNPDTNTAQTLSTHYWAYTKYLISGNYTAQFQDNTLLENIRFTEDRKVLNFKNYHSFRLNLNNSQPVLSIANKDGNSENFILEATRF